MNIVEKDFDGFRMDLDLDLPGISKPLYGYGKREEVFMSILDDEVKGDMACIDLGANIGYTTLCMLKNLGEGGCVYAIEPDPRNFALLERNINKNNIGDKCEMVPAAVSNETGEKDFWLSSSSNISSVQKTKSSTEQIKMNFYTLPDFLKGRRFPNFIKMDVEGHEVQILNGALDYFKNNEGDTRILMEVHPSFYNETDMNFAASLRRYFDIGFKTKYVISTPVAIPRLFKEAGYTPISTKETDRASRGLYIDIPSEDVIRFACYENKEKSPSKNKMSKKIVRAIMIERT